ncbi:MAG: sugar ABC transporter substrate-binding protein [Chloroflexi bacterium]|nr:sugar ABC transporter substrate-binding protein [Chloroflexota bacterium]
MEKHAISRRDFLRYAGLAAAGTALYACAPIQAPTQAPGTPVKEAVTIEWWTVSSEEYNEQVQRDLAKQFEASHPGIKVNVTVLPESGFQDKMTTTLGAGQGAPDVAFFWDNNWFPQALDLRPFIEKDNFDTSMYIEGFWKTRALWGDVVIGLPLGVGANFVMYNKDVFDEEGVEYPSWDVSTEEWLELLPKVTDLEKKRRWGGDRPRGPFRAIWFNYGARLYSDDSKTVEGYLNGPESVAAYTWLWDLVASNTTPTPADIEVLGTEGTGPVDLFLAGRLATATLNQGHMLNAVNAGANFGIVPEPGVPGNERWVNAWSLTCSIWKGTQHPEEAWAFLKYWVGPEGQRFLMENGNLFPSIRSVLHEYKDADKDYVQAFFKVLELRQVAEWRMTHLCERTVKRAIKDVWDRINLMQIKRDEIKAALDAAVPKAQAALEECVVRLGS